MTALVPKETITRYLGRNASPWVSYPMAAMGGFVLAVCSCTILPLFASIYAQGAGLGPAVTFLFVGPAINILAASYTGVAIGMDIALARIVLSVVFGIGIGLIMAFIYRQDDQSHSSAATAGGTPSTSAKLKPAIAIFLLLLLAVLLVGTLKIDLFTNVYGQVTLPLNNADGWQAALDWLVPYDASQGQEGISVQGVLLILLLGLIGVTAWLGLPDRRRLQFLVVGNAGPHWPHPVGSRPPDHARWRWPRGQHHRQVRWRGNRIGGGGSGGLEKPPRV